MNITYDAQVYTWMFDKQEAAPIASAYVIAGQEAVSEDALRLMREVSRATEKCFVIVAVHSNGLASTLGVFQAPFRKKDEEVYSAMMKHCVDTSIIAAKETTDTGKRLALAEAKATAIDWHGGQWSALYAIACGNIEKMSRKELLLARDEARRDILAADFYDEKRKLRRLIDTINQRIDTL